MNKKVLVLSAIVVGLAALSSWWLLRPRTMMSTLDGVSSEEASRRIRAMTPEQLAQLSREQDAEAERRYGAAGHRWSGRIEVSKMDDSTEASYENAALELIGGRQRRPRLSLRCEQNESSVQVLTDLTGGPADARHSVRLRFDDAAPAEAEWRFATNSIGGLVLVPDDASAILKQLAGAKSFLLEFEAASLGRHVISFDVHGLTSKLTSDLETENQVLRVRAEIDKKPVPSPLKPPCGWPVASAAK